MQTYKAEEWSHEESKYIINDRLGIQVNVEARLRRLDDRADVPAVR